MLSGKPGSKCTAPLGKVCEVCTAWVGTLYRRGSLICCIVCGRYAERRTLRLAQHCPGNVCRGVDYKLQCFRRNCHPHTGALLNGSAVRVNRVHAQPALGESFRVRTTSMCSSSRHEPRREGDQWVTVHAWVVDHRDGG